MALYNETPQATIDEWVKNLEPRMKSGLSLYKSCLDASIPYSTMLDIIKRDENVREKVDSFRAYQSILFTNIFHKLYIKIAEKITKGLDLTDVEWDRLKWLATHLPNTKKDYSDRTEITGAEGEALKITDHKPTADQLLNIFEAVEKIAKKIDEENIPVSDKASK